MLAAVLALLLSGCAHVVADWPENHMPGSEFTDLTPHPPSLRQSFESLPASPIAQGKVRLLNDNTEAWAARWLLLANARESIDVSYFILKQDVFGMAFLGHLLRKAEEGVAIRLMVDAQGKAMSQADGLDCLAALTANPNVSVKIYRPLPRRIIQAILTLNPVVGAASNHDKIIVSDGRTGLVGGRNIEAKYFAHPSELEAAFYDADILVQSPEASAALTKAFNRLYQSDQTRALNATTEKHVRQCERSLRDAYQVMDQWLWADKLQPDASISETEAPDSWRDEIRGFQELRGALLDYEPRYAPGEVRVINSLPRLGSTGDPITQSLFRLLRSTRHGVLIETPYLVLTQQAAAVLEQTGERGVKIRIFTNSPVSTDNALSQRLFQEQWPALLAEVPRLRIFVNGTRHNLHSKLAVFDNQLTVVGTYNLDPMSMAINGEIVVAVWSQSFAERVLEQLDDRLGAGPPTILEYRIQRNALGRPLCGPQGEVLIAFGPDDHSNPSQWPRQSCFWRLVGLSANLPIMPPLFGIDEATDSELTEAGNMRQASRCPVSLEPANPREISSKQPATASRRRPVD